jgi:hypothetical protein
MIWSSNLSGLRLKSFASISTQYNMFVDGFLIEIYLGLISNMITLMKWILFYYSLLVHQGAVTGPKPFISTPCFLFVTLNR